MTTPPGVLSAWEDHALPLHYAVWRQNEALLLKRLLAEQNQGTQPSRLRVADVGCGPARILREIGPLVGTYSGFDRDQASIDEARRGHTTEERFAFVGPALYEPHFESERVREYPFDLTLCLGNTLGILSGDPREHVVRMARASRGIFLSVIGRGLLPLREEYYRQNGISYEVDPHNGDHSLGDLGRESRLGRRGLRGTDSGTRNAGIPRCADSDCPSDGFCHLRPRRKAGCVAERFVVNAEPETNLTGSAFAAPAASHPLRQIRLHLS